MVVGQNTDVSQGSLAALALIVALFSAWNLYWGLRTGRTWCWPWSCIDRRESPWNFRVAIFGWIWMAIGSSWAFVIELTKH